MTISGQTLTYDSTHYFKVANYDTYDNTAYPLTVDDNFKHIATTIFNHQVNGVIAQFHNAAYKEVAYSDFDSDLSSPGYGFTISGSGSYTSVGSHAGNAKGLASTQTMTSPTLTKNAIALNYIFSIWVNATTAGTLTLTLTGVSTHPTISYSTGGWKYYEIKIPVGTLSSSYSVSFTVTNNISIDDILFYPDVAQATTATYDPLTHYKVAATNTNGVSAYFTNDQWGRLLYAYDQDKNIVQKNSFLTPADVQGLSFGTISVPSSVAKGTAIGFGINGPNACSALGATVTWHFGDGTSSSASLLATSSHTYTSVGKKAVTATITSQTLGTFTLGPDTIMVTATPIHVTYENNTYSNGNITTVSFISQTGGTNYSFTGSNLNNSYIVPDNYAITVTLSGGTQYVPGSGSTGPGYGSMGLTGDCWTHCFTYLSSNTYTTTTDLSSCTTLDFSVNQSASCP